MTQFGFYFDATRCTGCKTCELACKDYHDLDAQLNYRRVYDYEGGTWYDNQDGTWHTDAYVYHVSLTCNHCDDAVCIEVCPTGAMHREDNGIVRVNKRVCIGCGYCMLACPYHAPSVSDITHTSAKCDGCYDRLLESKEPICTESCPLRALEWGDIDKLREKYGTLAEIAPLPEQRYTLPNLVIKTTAAMRPPGDTSGKIANIREVL